MKILQSMDNGLIQSIMKAWKMLRKEILCRAWKLHVGILLWTKGPFLCSWYRKRQTMGDYVEYDFEHYKIVWGNKGQHGWHKCKVLLGRLVWCDKWVAWDQACGALWYADTSQQDVSISQEGCWKLVRLIITKMHLVVNGWRWLWWNLYACLLEKVVEQVTCLKIATPFFGLSAITPSWMINDYNEKARMAPIGAATTI